MPSLIAYRKVSDEYTTYQLLLPEGETNGERVAQEIATLPDGRTIVVLADGVSLPANQPAQIAASIEVATNPTAAQLDAVRKASPHAKLVWERGWSKFRAEWDENEERVILRVAVGKLLGLYTPTARENAMITKYFDDFKTVTTWIKQNQTKLGL